MLLTVPISYSSQQAEECQAVDVAGSFNSWQRVSMVRQPNGGWTTTLKLEPGSYPFKFIVDDNVWRHDPDQPTTDDNMGGLNNVIEVKERTGLGVGVGSAKVANELKTRAVKQAKSGVNDRKNIDLIKSAKAGATKSRSAPINTSHTNARKQWAAPSNGSDLAGLGKEHKAKGISDRLTRPVGQKVGGGLAKPADNPLLVSPCTRGRLAKVTGDSSMLGGNKQTVAGPKLTSSNVTADRVLSEAKKVSSGPPVVRAGVRQSLTSQFRAGKTFPNGSLGAWNAKVKISTVREAM
jgi:hypothetical protein